MTHFSSTPFYKLRVLRLLASSFVNIFPPSSNVDSLLFCKQLEFNILVYGCQGDFLLNIKVEIHNNC
jgi:hypothetical protein